MAELVLGLDFETTGLDADKGYITEIGAVLFDGNTWKPTAELSRFVYEPKALPLTEEIVKLTGITDQMLKDEGIGTKEALLELANFASEATAFIAHNAAFDKAFFEASVKRSGVDLSLATMTKPWYCSKGDVEEHVGKRCTKLSHLAVDYGATVDGSKLHRALDDVLLMGEMLKGAGTSFKKIKTFADMPWIYIKADVSFSEKDLAKADGFGWETCVGTYEPRFTKTWVKRLKQPDFQKEMDKGGFRRIKL